MGAPFLPFLVLATMATPPVPTITICGAAQPPVLTAQLEVLVEAFGADDTGTPANPVARFDGVRVHYGVEATTLDPDRQGEDGGLEPSLGLFEPLRPDGRYYLPWDIPAGTKLVDGGEWGGWDAWLGNDNDAIDDNALELVDVKRDRVRLRWTGRTSDCDFLLEGDVAIGEVRVSAPADADIGAVLATLFGDAIARTRVDVERREDSWTKTTHLVALITPKREGKREQP